jgi:lipopolysaccharide/colanic/teichoic acid biosynthesis glycosyltransferase
LTLGVLAADVAALSVALMAAHRLALARSVSAQAIWYAPESFPAMLWFVVPIAIALFALGRLYVLDELFEGSIEYGRVVYGCTLAALSVIVLGFWGKFLQDVAPSRTLIVLVWALSVFTVGSSRFAIRRVVRFLRRRGYFVSRAVIVGLGASGVGFARHFEQTRHSGMKVVGFVDDFLPPGTPVLGELKVLGPPSALDAILEQTGAHEVIIVPTATAWESFQDLIRRLSSMNGYAVRLAPGSRDLLATTLRPHYFASIPMLTVERVRITGLDRVLKSALDYCVAALLLPYAVMSLLFAAIVLRASGVRAFRRVRLVGRAGAEFTALVLNTGAAPPSVRRRVRHAAADRLPQLLNVLLGRMSIVGPRPIAVDEQRAYATWLPSLLAVKPGLTGPWLVRPASSREEEMEASLFYIRNYTIWLDVEVLLRSVFRRASTTAAAPGEEKPPVGERAPAHQ